MKIKDPPSSCNLTLDMLKKARDLLMETEQDLHPQLWPRYLVQLHADQGQQWAKTLLEQNPHAKAFYLMY